MEDKIFTTKQNSNDIKTYVDKLYNLNHKKIDKNCDINFEFDIYLIDSTISDVILTLTNKIYEVSQNKIFYFKDFKGISENNNIIINGNGISIDNKDFHIISKNYKTVRLIFLKEEKMWITL